MLDDARISKLTADEVQVWQIEFDEALLSEADLLQTLSHEEIKRAGRLRVGQVRMQFLVGKSCVRKLLGAELGVAPETVQIVCSEYGKPEVLHATSISVHFNVAHSRSTVLIAMSLTGPVGIDIEYLDRNTDVLEVARHALTPRENQLILDIDDISTRNRTFFECWTRKEALVKADGRGLSLPLTSFEVPVGQTCQKAAVEIPGNGRELQRRYFVSDIALDQRVACAFAVADRPAGYRLHTLSATAL